MLFSRFCFIFTFLRGAEAYFRYENEIQLIVDVARSRQAVKSVASHICWEFTAKQHLVKQLMSSNPMKTVQFVNETWLQMKLEREEYLMVVLDVNCPTANSFLTKASAMKKLSFPYRWLIIGRPTNESGAISSQLHHLALLPDSDVVIAERSDSDSFVLSSIYKMNVNRTWQLEDIGNWTFKTGVLKSELSKSCLAIRRKNFQGHPIKITIVVLNNKTKADLFDLSDFQTDTVTKSNFRSTVTLIEYLNSSYQVIYSDTWGYYKNGQFDGMVGDLTAGDADIGGTLMFVSKERMESVDFLNSPTAILIKFVFREPPLSYQNNLFLLPFRTNVWCCIGAFIIVLTFILYVAAFWDKKLSEKNVFVEDHTALKPFVSDVLIMVISAVAQQGTDLQLRGNFGRVVMIILFLSFLLLFSAYSASIVALLQSSSNQIQTLADLYNSKLELGVEDTLYNRHYFKVATEPLRKAIYQTKIAPPGKKPKFFNIEDGVKKLRIEPFAFNMNTGVGYRLMEKYFHEHEKCGIKEISYLDDLKTYITCRKNSPYKEIFKIGMFRLKEHGICDRENNLIFSRRPTCQSRGGTFESVNMVDFHPVLLMYVYGIIFAFLLLAIEILIHRRHRSQIISEMETT